MTLLPIRTFLKPLTVENPQAAAIHRTTIFCTEKSSENTWMDSYLSMLTVKNLLW